MKPLLRAYQVLATVVGLSIITLILIGVPLEHAYEWWPNLLPDHLYQGSPLQSFGYHVDAILGTAHGFIYLGFLLVAFALARRARWSLPYTVVTLVCGTIPIVSFVAETKAVRKVKREFPELVGERRATASSSGPARR